jgi:hypothetical protein
MFGGRQQGASTGQSNSGLKAYDDRFAERSAVRWYYSAHDVNSLDFASGHILSF